MPDFTTKQREKLAEEDEAMPDGSYPIRNRADLKRAIQAFGRSKNPEKTKAWIKKRARELDAEDLIPESWLEHIDDDSEYLIHYGVLGMKWGMNRAAKSGTTYSYKSHRTKSLEKGLSKAKAKNNKVKSDKTKAKVSKMSSALKTSKSVDKKRQAYAKNTSVGKGIAQQILFGPIGARTYQSMRATGSKRSDAILTQIASTALDVVLPVNVGTAYNISKQISTETGGSKKKKTK